MQYKAICTDIDGTLLNVDRQLSRRTITAMENLPLEVPVILASSRMPSAMRHLQEELGITHCPMICFNGAYVLAYDDHDRAQVLHSQGISVGICKQLVAKMAGTGLHIGLYRANEWYIEQDDQWSAREERNTKTHSEIAEYDSLLPLWEDQEAGPHKIMCMGEEALVQQAEDFLYDHFGDQLRIYRSKPTYLEIAPRSCSKAKALQIVLDHLGGIAMREVVAFGDNFNDIDLLEAVGMGIAVGNAFTEVKASANEITLKSKEDGVAVAIEKHF